MIWAARSLSSERSPINGRTYIGIKKLKGYGIKYHFYSTGEEGTSLIKLFNDRSMEVLFEHEFEYLAGPISGANYEVEIPFVLLKDANGNWTVYNLITEKTLEIVREDAALYLKEADKNYFYFEDAGRYFFLYNFDLELIKTGKTIDFQ